MTRHQRSWNRQNQCGPGRPGRVLILWLRGPAVPRGVRRPRWATHRLFPVPGEAAWRLQAGLVPFEVAKQLEEEVKEGLGSGLRGHGHGGPRPEPDHRAPAVLEPGKQQPRRTKTGVVGQHRVLRGRAETWGPQGEEGFDSGSPGPQDGVYE